MTRRVHGPTVCPLSPALLAGLTSLQAAVILLCIDPRWTLLTLSSLVVVILIAPFLCRWSYFLPVLSCGDRIVRATFFEGRVRTHQAFAVAEFARRFVRPKNLSN